MFPSRWQPESAHRSEKGSPIRLRRRLPTAKQQKRVVPGTGWFLVTGCIAALMAAMLPAPVEGAASSTTIHLRTSAVAQGKDGKRYRLRLEAFKESGSDTVLGTGITAEMWSAGTGSSWPNRVMSGPSRRRAPRSPGRGRTSSSTRAPLSAISAASR